MPQAEAFIRVRGTESVIRRLERLADSSIGRELHERIATRVHAWVAANIEQGGVERTWAPLRPNTVYGKRMSQKGNRTPRPLAGMLRYLNSTATSTEARVGFATKVAVFHQWGTRGPYTIAPRFKRALSFPSLFGARRSPATVRRLWLTPRQLQRRGALQRATMFQAAGRSRTDFSRLNFTTVKSVQHPGLPARPLLPSARLAQRLANEVARGFLQELRQRGV